MTPCFFNSRKKEARPLATSLTQLIQQLKSMGIETPVALPISAIKGYHPIYEAREAQRLLSGFEPNHKDAAQLYQYLQPWQTIIGMVFPYSLLPLQRKAKPTDISRVSIMAWEWDYHQVIQNKIKAALGDEFSYQIHVDSGPLPERSIALQMGLGKPGRNQCLIHPVYGTAFHLAFLLVSLEGEATVGEEVSLGEESAATTVAGQSYKSFSLAEICENCQRCQDHCPSGALTGVADFNGQTCISALTQKKGLLTEEEKELIGKQLYGCDLCQLSCPANAPLSEKSNLDDLMLTRKTANAMNPSDLLGLSQKQFKKNYGAMGFSWRGVKTNKRNALINMGNSRDGHWINVIEDYLTEQASLDGEVLVETALWALSRLKGNCCER